MKLSIKARITLWYAALLGVICAAALTALLTLASHAQTRYARDTLESASVVILDEMEVEHGLLEIDADIDEIPNVYASLFDARGELIYGRRRVNLPFEAGALRRTRMGALGWYVLDTRIDVPETDAVWLRVYMSTGQTLRPMQALARYGLWMLPVLAAAALWGGYALTGRALRPVREMTQVASAIAAGGDLNARAALARYRRGGRDELHALAATLEDMLARLSGALERERQFANDAAHELRTPLNAMRTQGEYALSRSDAREKDEAVARMLEKNEEMRRLVDQLLTIARLDAGQMEMEDGVALAQVIADVAQDMEIVAAERHMRVETALEAVRVRGNRPMLTRAAANLMDNAIRYGRAGGTVRVTLTREAGDAVVCVQDDGAGLPPEALAHVFDRFWRGDGARHTEGTGIGLAVVQAAARAHGGSVQVQSEPGAGCRFTIRIPRSESP